jgi:menaquinone-dependent protoporphyrinogen oxidase
VTTQNLLRKSFFRYHSNQINPEKGKQMPKNILIAYGSEAGSTAEVAEAIGKEMRAAGAETHVQPVEMVKDIKPYDAVVVGSAVRIFRVLGKTQRFLRKHKKYLQKIPTAYFLVCLTMAEGTPENIEKAKKFAKPMLNTTSPVSLGLFGGCMDPDKLTGFAGKAMQSQPKADHRDWDLIQVWARETLNKFDL